MRAFGGGFFVMAVLAATVGCNSSAPPHNTSATDAAVSQTPPPRKVSANNNDAFVAMGPITVEQQLDVTALREGIITALDADVDSAVRKGQVLARLDDRQLLAERDAAEHKVRSIEADVKNWESEVKVRQVDLQRSEELLKAGIVTQQQVDHDRYNMEATQHEVDRERENLLNARANLQAAELELEKTRIAAPFAGIVARRYVRLGQRVVSGDKLFWLTATEPLQVRFALPEQYGRDLKLGDPLVLSPTSAQGESGTAKIIHLSPVADPASGTIEVIASVVKPASFRPGMTASIRIPKSQ